MLRARIGAQLIAIDKFTSTLPSFHSKASFILIKISAQRTPSLNPRLCVHLVQAEIDKHFNYE